MRALPFGEGNDDACVTGRERRQRDAMGKREEMRHGRARRGCWEGGGCGAGASARRAWGEGPRMRLSLPSLEASSEGRRCERTAVPRMEVRGRRNFPIISHKYFL